MIGIGKRENNREDEKALHNPTHFISIFCLGLDFSFEKNDTGDSVSPVDFDDERKFSFHDEREVVLAGRSERFVEAVKE